VATVASEARNPDSGKELTILEHLQELRRRLIISSAAILVGVGASFYLTRQYFLEWLIAPARDRVENVNIVFTDPLGYWSAYFRIALVAGIGMAMPVLVYQLMAFVGPGLTKQERRWIFPIVIGASLAFIGGALFAYYIELPPALGFLLNSSAGIEPFLNVTSYVDFVTKVMLVTGLVFELPLVIMGLAKFRVVHWRKLLGWWRQAIIVAFVVSAIVTPSIDPVTQTLVAIPIIVLYFVGIFLAWLVDSKRVKQE
jgi:sec-independent protein translocase protein TatC